jgi:TorA maturation chaperone TorD
MTPALKRAGSPGSNGSARAARERGNLYGFLAEVFRAEPTTGLLRKVRAKSFLTALSEAGAILTHDFFDGAADTLADELAIEYTRLFVGPGKHIPPYESVQREGALWGKSTCEVSAFIRRSGFAYDPNYHGLPDHVSVELEFMRELTRQEALAWARGNDYEARRCLRIERDFLRDHLARWVPLFCGKVVEETESAFYKELAAMTGDFIRSEHEEVERRISLSQ